MIPVQLKAKHYYFVVNDLKNFSAAEFYPLIKRIAMQCGGVADDDLITVNTSVYDFVKIFQIVANKSEGQANRINTEMMQLLTPQMQQGVVDENPEWIDAATQINNIREANWAITDAAISSGKSFIQNS